MPKYPETDLLIEAGIKSSENKWISKGVGLIGIAIIVTAKKTNSKIWTLDKNLNNILPETERYIP